VLAWHYYTPKEEGMAKKKEYSKDEMSRWMTGFRRFMIENDMSGDFLMNFHYRVFNQARGWGSDPLADDEDRHTVHLVDQDPDIEDIFYFWKIEIDDGPEGNHKINYDEVRIEPMDPDDMQDYYKKKVLGPFSKMLDEMRDEDKKDEYKSKKKEKEEEEAEVVFDRPQVVSEEEDRDNFFQELLYDQCPNCGQYHIPKGESVEGFHDDED
jgi:hypothetical protein